MEIKIVTDGEVQNTKLFMNGEEVDFHEFNIGASLHRGAGVKMQLDRKVGGFCSYYRGDFKKMDEAHGNRRS